MSAQIYILPVIRSLNAPAPSTGYFAPQPVNDDDTYVIELAAAFSEKIKRLAEKDGSDPDEIARAVLIYGLAAMEQAETAKVDVMSFYARTMRPSASTG